MTPADVAYVLFCLLVDAGDVIFDMQQIDDWRTRDGWIRAAHFCKQLAGKTQQRWRLKDSDAIAD